MRAILPFAIFVRVAHALIFRLPSTSTTPGTFTITYQSETSDPAGKMTFWYGHTDGAGGYLIAAENVAHTKSPTPLQVDIPVTAADGLQWQLAAGPVQNFPGNFFASSDIFTINAASSSSATSTVNGTTAKSISPSPSTSAFSRSPSPASVTTVNTSANLTPSSSTVVSSDSKQPSLSVGLIVGVTFAATVVLALALGFLLFRVRRQRRARRRVKDIEPAWVSAPGSGTESAFDSAAAIEPYTAAPSSATPSAAMAGSGSKAAAERQAYLTNQLAAVQAQLAALSLSTTPGVVDSPNSATDEPGALREQNAALHARVGVLEEQLRSQWAQGLSDEPPPRYHDLE